MGAEIRNSTLVIASSGLVSADSRGII